jgi:hypothetical protein
MMPICKTQSCNHVAFFVWCHHRVLAIDRDHHPVASHVGDTISVKTQIAREFVDLFKYMRQKARATVVRSETL